jgi:hypothetical protein
VSSPAWFRFLGRVEPEDRAILVELAEAARAHRDRRGLFIQRLVQAVEHELGVADAFDSAVLAELSAELDDVTAGSALESSEPGDDGPENAA